MKGINFWHLLTLWKTLQELFFSLQCALLLLLQCLQESKKKSPDHEILSYLSMSRCFSLVVFSTWLVTCPTHPNHVANHHLQPLLKVKFFLFRLGLSTPTATQLSVFKSMKIMGKAGWYSCSQQNSDQKLLSLPRKSRIRDPCDGFIVLLILHCGLTTPGWCILWLPCTQITNNCW